MTIFYPDVSHYDAGRGVTLQPGTVAVITKATHGTAFLDSAYATFKAQAAKVGAFFAAYHWLNHGGAAAQAAYCYSQIGDVPVMVDAEDVPGNTGYSGNLTVEDIVEFVVALRAEGGRVNLVYLPRWYWDTHMGGPSLQPLQDIGVGLVSSNYTTYADTGPGWNTYVRSNGAVEPSAMQPTCWQYTNQLPYSNSYCDFNAFRGTLDEFRSLMTAGPGVDMDAVQNYRLKILFENWDPTRDQWIAAGGDPAVWDAANAAGSARNGVKQALVGLSDGLTAATAKIDSLAAKLGVSAAAIPGVTQDQLNAAMAAAMKDPTVQAGIGAAIAAHLHVN